MRARATLDRQPAWEGIFRGWATKFIAKNKWRVDPINEFDDLINDAYAIFRHVLASYPLISDPRHIMALFQRAMINEYHDKAKEWRRRRTAEVSFEMLVSEDLKLVDSLGEENNEGLLRAILGELPPEVRAALEILSNAEKLAILREPKVQSRLAILAGLPAKRESLNEALCRIIRLPKTTNLLGMLKSALTE